MTKHTKHAREFNYGYGVSKIVSVELSSTGAAVGLSADGGEKIQVGWISSHFSTPPRKWLVDGYGGEVSLSMMPGYQARSEDEG